MPRIPEAAFDTNFSTRVGRANVVDAPDTAGGLIKAAGQLTGAFATLQDQEERTEAITFATKARTEYNNEKLMLDLALKHADHDGNYVMPDPSDKTEDITKRRTVTGNVQDNYKKLRDMYVSTTEKAKGVRRTDIAEQLVNRYIGDDLTETQLKAEMELTRKKEKYISTEALKTIDFTLGSVIEMGADPNAAPELVSAAAYRAKNELKRTLEAHKPIIGAEAYTQLQNYNDRALAGAAEKILQSNVTDKSVQAANMLIESISDPKQKAFEKVRVQRLRRATAEIKNTSLAEHAVGLAQTMDKLPAMTEQHRAKAYVTAKSLLNTYTDPTLMGPSKEDLQNKAVALAGRTAGYSVFSKVMAEDKQIVFGGDRTPTSEGTDEPSVDTITEKELRDRIADDIKVSGIRLTPELELLTIEQGVQAVKSKMANLKDSLPSIVKAQMPNATFAEQIAAIKKKGATHAQGNVPIADKDDQKAFQESYTQAVAKGGFEAAQFFFQTLNKTGAATEGFESHRRELMIDLVAKNEKLNYLVPLADADPQVVAASVQEAAAYKANLESAGESGASLEKAVAASMNQTFKNLASSPIRDGMKQLMAFRAASHMAAGSSKSSAVEKAKKEIGSLYTAHVSDDGQSTLLLANANRNYEEVKPALATGLEAAKTLPHLSYEQKVELYKKYFSKNKNEPPPPAYHLDYTFRTFMRVAPMDRYPNVHQVVMGGLPVTMPDKSSITLTAEQLLKLGQPSQLIKNMQPEAKPEVNIGGDAMPQGRKGREI